LHKESMQNVGFRSLA